MGGLRPIHHNHLSKPRPMDFADRPLKNLSRGFFNGPSPGSALCPPPYVPSWPAGFFVRNVRLRFPGKALPYASRGAWRKKPVGAEDAGRMLIAAWRAGCRAQQMPQSWSATSRSGEALFDRAFILLQATFTCRPIVLPQTARRIQPVRVQNFHDRSVVLLGAMIFGTDSRR